MTRTDSSQFVVRVKNATTNKNEEHYFDTKPQAESFRSGCKPSQYIKPVVYPVQLFDKLNA
jgi:hypothetical protein